MTDIEALIHTAEARGYTVRWHKGGPKAAWIPRAQTVTLRHGMSDVETLCSLAHELGHAWYEDPPGHDGWRETRAWEFAARLLISHVDYQLAESLYGPQPSRLAHELGVTVKVLKTWQTLFERQAA